MALIEIGRAAPAFTLPDQFGKSHSIRDYKGRTVVLYFYPKDDTSDCTAEACQFRDHRPDFSKIKAVVLGVSPDDEASHARFASEHALDFPLLADPKDAGGTARVCDAYGVWQKKSMYGRTYNGVVRTTYLIGPDGKVARRWDRVKVTGHVPEVLAAVRELHAGRKLFTVDAELKPLKKSTSTKGTRTQGGHPGYSGVLSTKGKSTRNRSTATQERRRGTASRGKARVGKKR